MAIAFRAAAHGTALPGTAANVTIPASVQSGDTVFLFGAAIGLTGTSLVFTSTGTSPTLIESHLSTNFSSTKFAYAVAWFTASGTDAGKVATLKANDNDSNFMCITCGAWSGAGTSQPDVIAHNDTGASTSATFTAPSATTATNGDWELDWAFAAGGTVTITGNPGTQRDNPGATFSAALADSNASVGGSGTTIGGGTWTANSTDTWAGFTIGLAPPVGNVSLVTDAVTLAAPLLTPMVGPDPFPAPNVALAAPVPSLTFGAASIPLPVAQIALAAPLIAPVLPGGGDDAPWHIRRGRQR